MKRSKIGIILGIVAITAIISTAISPSVEAATCLFGTGKRAVKLLGKSHYTTPCRVTECLPWGAVAIKSEIAWGPMQPDISYVYEIQPGPSPTISCASEVSDDDWEF